MSAACTVHSRGLCLPQLKHGTQLDLKAGMEVRCSACGLMLLLRFFHCLAALPDQGQQLSAHALHPCKYTAAKLALYLGLRKHLVQLRQQQAWLV